MYETRLSFGLFCFIFILSLKFNFFKGPTNQEADVDDLEAAKHILTAKVINAFVHQAVVARRGKVRSKSVVGLPFYQIGSENIFKGPMDEAFSNAEDERILKEKVKRAYAVRVVAAARGMVLFFFKYSRRNVRFRPH